VATGDLEGRLKLWTPEKSEEATVLVEAIEAAREGQSVRCLSANETGKRMLVAVQRALKWEEGSEGKEKAQEQFETQIQIWEVEE
jgi:hypothetical protein